MPPRRTRFVTVCQQLLTLGVICAVVTPAAGVLSLDLVPEQPDRADRAGASSGAAGLAAAPFQDRRGTATGGGRRADVPTRPVTPDVTDVALTAPAGARVRPGALEASRKVRGGGHTVVTSDPQDVTGYGTVGVTWAHGEDLPEDAVAVKVRTRDAGRWSGWQALEYHDEHGPDAGSAEARRSRPGTEPMLVGEVEKVQVKVDTDRPAPDDLTLAVIDPGTAARTERERPAIEATQPSASRRDSQGSGDGRTARAAMAVAPRPQIFSRAQWGADESMRDKGSLRYGTIKAGFVHHTVNANDYTKEQVPSLLRGIYAYHTRSRGWSDVGYNFLVDRFGRIWEGRAGGVDKAVVGAHTLGYNDYAFAMSAIGNYDVARPSEEIVKAYGALMAWKLSLAGVKADATNVAVGRGRFNAISGHRDAGSTACPGRYLYARLPDIRRLAAQAQAGAGTPTTPTTPTPPPPTPDPAPSAGAVGDLVGGPQPDLVVRRASDGRGVVLPIETQGKGYTLGRAVDTGLDLTGANRILNAGDWDGDGIGDLVVRRAGGTLTLYPGEGDGTFGTARTLATGFSTVGLLAAGDVTGDGVPDLVGQPSGAGITLWPGDGEGGLGASRASSMGRISAARQVVVGNWDGDEVADSVTRTGPSLTLRPGGTSRARTFQRDFSPYDWVTGVGDVGLSGRTDLVLRERATGRLLLSQTAKNGSVGAPTPLTSTSTPTPRGAYDLVG